MPKIEQEIVCPNCSVKIPLTLNLGELTPPLSEAEKVLSAKLEAAEARLLEMSERFDAMQVPPPVEDPPTPAPAPASVEPPTPEADVFGDE